MAPELLVNQQMDEGRLLLAVLGRNGFEVRAAAWLRDAEKERWHLYLVAPAATTDLREAFGTVFDAVYRAKLTAVDFSSVKLVRPDEPLGRVLQAVAARWADRVPRGTTRYHSSDLSLLGYDDALFYPAAGQMTPAQVARAVADMLSGGELDQPQNGIYPLATAEYQGRSLSLKPTGIRLDPSTRRLVVEHENPPGSGKLETIPADEITDVRLQ